MQVNFQLTLYTPLNYPSSGWEEHGDLNEAEAFVLRVLVPGVNCYAASIQLLRVLIGVVRMGLAACLEIFCVLRGELRMRCFIIHIWLRFLPATAMSLSWRFFSGPIYACGLPFLHCHTDLTTCY